MPRLLSTSLKTALSTLPNLLKADLFTFTLNDGTVYRWAAWDADITDPAGNVFASANPWITRGQWNLTNTMAIPSLNVTIMVNNSAFSGGAQLKTQIHNGLLDGATCLLQYAFMSTPGDMTIYGALNIFSGVVAGINIEGGKVVIAVKAKTDLLDQMAPRNVYQIGCNHSFCDSGCSLPRATYTTSYTVGSSPAPTNSFIPWSSAPANPGRYLSGTIKITSGAATGQSRTLANADATGLTLTYPLYETPAVSDTFTAFEGCNKQIDDGVNIQDCTARSNTANYDGFPFVPPPTAAI